MIFHPDPGSAGGFLLLVLNGCSALMPCAGSEYRIALKQRLDRMQSAAFPVIPTLYYNWTGQDQI